MKLKLDENLGRHVQQLFRDQGHEAVTIAGERLSSASDESLIEACRREGRALVTLDLDFGNPLLFRPSEYPGIAVLRLPPKPAHADLLAAVRTLLRALAEGEIAGKLWIVQPGRLREYQESRRD
jgi:predicted nuclease of predicted toxin-antitoxin system